MTEIDHIPPEEMEQLSDHETNENDTFDVTPEKPRVDNEDEAEDTADAVPSARGRRRATQSHDEGGLRRKLLLIIGFVLVLWLAYSIQAHRARKEKLNTIIYASRYSKEHKFRPAASPIITETLKDGRIRLRGATPPPPTPTPTTKSRRRRNRKRKGGKKKGTVKK